MKRLVISTFAIFLMMSLSTMAFAAEELPFDQALQEMINANVEYRVQKTKLNIAESQVTAARAAFSPSLALKAEQSNSGGNAAFQGPTPYASAVAYTANAQWNIFRSGADVAGVRAANQDRSFEESTLEGSFLSAEDKAVRALLNLIERKQALEAYRRSEDSVRHLLEIARARFAKSLLSREEADRVAVDASNTEARRTDAEVLYNDALAAVESLLGHTRVALSWPWEKRINIEQARAYLQEGARPLESRPDFLAARFAMEREESRSRSLFGALLPSVDLGYSVGETHSRGDTNSEWKGLATLTIPLWSGLKDYAGYKVQVQNKYAAETRLSQLRTEVASSVTAAQANFRVSVQLLQSRSKNLGLARHILEQDETRFKIGRSDANELRTDIERVTEAEILAVQGIRQAHVAYMVLLHEFGKRVTTP